MKIKPLNLFRAVLVDELLLATGTKPSLNAPRFKELVEMTSLVTISYLNELKEVESLIVKMMNDQIEEEELIKKLDTSGKRYAYIAYLIDCLECKKSDIKNIN